MKSALNGELIGSSSGKIAVFDVCGTLYSSNTTHDFVEFYLQQRPTWRLSVFKLLRIRLLNLFWASLSWATGRDVFRLISVNMLRGAPAEGMNEMAAAFVRSFLETRARGTVLSLMDELRRENFRIVLASASLEWVVREIARILNADCFFACTVSVDDGRIVGSFSCDIRGQKHRVVAGHFPLAEDVVAITDNREDAELIRMSSRAWIICDKRKRKRWTRMKLQNFTFLD
jgi:HAD superfamily phosphoserine phosphatase-like hydrolase